MARCNSKFQIQVTGCRKTIVTGHPNEKCCTQSRHLQQRAIIWTLDWKVAKLHWLKYPQRIERSFKSLQGCKMHLQAFCRLAFQKWWCKPDILVSIHGQGLPNHCQFSFSARWVHNSDHGTLKASHHYVSEPCTSTLPPGQCQLHPNDTLAKPWWLTKRGLGGPFCPQDLLMQLVSQCCQ